MAEAKKKNYVRGSSIEHTFNNGSKVNNFSINIEDANVVAAAKNGWVQFCMSEKQEVDRYKNTHYIYISDFVPDKAKGKAQSANVGIDDIGDTEMPF